MPRPKDLRAGPNSAEAARTSKYWYQTVQEYLATLSELRREGDQQLNKIRIVRSCLSAEIFPYVEDADNYDSIIATLRQLYVKPKNNIYARHPLVSRKQVPSETVSEYLLALRLLAKDCVFQEVTASIYCDELIWDSFINGLSSAAIRQRLWKTEDITLQRASEMAESLERVHKQQTSMDSHNIVASLPKVKTPHQDELNGSGTECKNSFDNGEAVASITNSKMQPKPKGTCFYCGGPVHSRNFCPLEIKPAISAVNEDILWKHVEVPQG